MTHHLHLACIIPYIRPHNTTWSSDSFHFSDSALRLRNKVKHEARDSRIKSSRVNRQDLSIPHLKLNPAILRMFLRKSDKVLGAIDPHDSSWFCKLKNDLAEHACSTTNIQPLASLWYRQPFQELTGNQTTPAAHIDFVVLGTCPGIFWLGRHRVFIHKIIIK